MKKRTAPQRPALGGKQSPQIQSTDWGYAEHNGPDKWAELGFGTCGSGMHQSPIDIDVGSALAASAPKIHYRYGGPVRLEVEHNGRSVQANLQDVRSIVVDGVERRLSQFHFHTQSEHTVNGEHAPMEMHLVHTADDGTLTVIGVFIVEGREDNHEFEKIWSDLPRVAGETTHIAKFDLMQLLPPVPQRSYRYTGSLTTPPCAEDVNWIVLVNPITMSNGQMDKFKMIFSGAGFPAGNRRPTQPLNGRQVTFTALGTSR